MDFPFKTGCRSCKLRQKDTWQIGVNMNLIHIVADLVPWFLTQLGINRGGKFCPFGFEKNGQAKKHQR